MSLNPGSARARLRTNLKLGIWEAMLAIPIVYMTLPANFIVAGLLTHNFPVPEATFGLIASMPFWSNVVQLALVPLLDRWARPKTLTLLMAGLHGVTWALLALALARIPPGDPDVATRWFVGFFALACLLQSICGIAWTSWIQEWTPERIRGSYFGVRNRAIQFVTVGMLLGAGWWLDATNNSIATYQAIICLAALARAVSLLLQSWIFSHAGDGPHRREAPARWWDQFDRVRRASSLVRYLAFGASFGFASNLFGPFCLVFMYEHLDLSAGTVGSLMAAGSIGGAMSFPAWGRLMDRYGNKPVMIFTLVAWQIMNFGWCVMTPDRVALLYGMFVWGGMMSAGFFLGSFNLMLKLVPQDAKAVAISLHTGLSSLVAAIAPILGGAILESLLASNFDPASTYRACIGVTVLLSLASVVLLARTPEPNAGSVRAVIGAMRSYRQIASMLGLGFMVNYVFAKRR